MIFPLVTADDFLSYAALPRTAPGVPVLVSMAEKQELLLRLVEQAFRELQPLDDVLIAARIPTGGRMSERLLAANVFIVHDFALERARLLEEGHAVLTIADGIVRHPAEIGHNQVEMEWHTPDPDPQRWEAFALSIASLGILRAARTELR
jgi:hypothetical protein